MIDQPFRNWLSNKAGPIIKFYQAVGLTPNGVTVMGCGFGVFASVALGIGFDLCALLLWWTGRLFDGTDGIYARTIGKASDFGGYLDILADMIAYSAMILGFAVSRPEFMNWWLVILFLYVLCITSALALGSLERSKKLDSGDNRSLRLAAGLAEGGETGIAYTFLLLFPGGTNWACPIWGSILLITVVARTLVAYHELKS
jgi:phosphatidylglycerophosphate synthase